MAGEKKSQQLDNQEENGKKGKKLKYYEGVGRRKTAIARVRLYPTGKKGAGKIMVNESPVEEYWPGDYSQRLYLEPLRTTNTLNRFQVSVKVRGSGKSAQLGAFVHGVSRALIKFDQEKFRPILKKRGFLTRDARMKERRKPGLAHAARAAKQSPKR